VVHAKLNFSVNNAKKIVPVMHFQEQVSIVKIDAFVKLVLGMMVKKPLHVLKHVESLLIPK